ncbi:MAG: hypothetical protein PVF23_09605, partial [Chromatiales bacterium]
MSSAPRISQLIEDWSQQLEDHSPPPKSFLDRLRTTLSGSEFVLQVLETKPHLLTDFYSDGALDKTPTAA